MVTQRWRILRQGSGIPQMHKQCGTSFLQMGRWCSRTCAGWPPSCLSLGSSQIATNSITLGQEGRGNYQQFGGQQIIRHVRGAEKHFQLCFHRVLWGLIIARLLLLFFTALQLLLMGTLTVPDSLSSVFHLELPYSPVTLIFFQRRTVI